MRKIYRCVAWYLNDSTSSTLQWQPLRIFCILIYPKYIYLYVYSSTSHFNFDLIPLRVHWILSYLRILLLVINLYRTTVLALSDRRVVGDQWRVMNSRRDPLKIICWKILRVIHVDFEITWLRRPASTLRIILIFSIENNRKKQIRKAHSVCVRAVPG